MELVLHGSDPGSATVKSGGLCWNDPEYIDVWFPVQQSTPRDPRVSTQITILHYFSTPDVVYHRQALLSVP